MTYVDLVLERLATDPDREAVIGGDTRLTRAQARDLLFRLADGLVRRGIKPGDGVAVYVGNTPEAVLLNLAVHLLGGRLVYVPPEPGTAELKALIERADVAAVVVDPSFGTQIDGWHLQDLPGDPVERTPAPDFATVYYTGGTTGLPKLAVHPSGRDTLWRQRASLPPMNLLCNTLITHGSGAGAVLTALLTGSKLVLGPSTFDADTFVRLARDEQITATVFVPPMMYEVLDHPDCPGPQFGVIVGGSPLAPKRLRQAIEKWGPHVTQGYELHRGKLIVYSLGNFLFNGFDTEATLTGWVLSARLGKDRTQDWRIHIAKLDANGVPHPAAEPLPCMAGSTTTRRGRCRPAE